jgi:hypothetical protein
MSAAASTVRFRYPTGCETALPLCFDSPSNLNQAVDFFYGVSCLKITKQRQRRKLNATSRIRL